MDKVGKQMSIYMGVTLSLCLSLVGTLTSGHFTVPALLTGFVVGMVISIALGFVIPVKKLTDAVCEELEVEENTGAGRCISALVSDVLYTPVITLAMVILAYVNTVSHGGSMPFVPALVKSFVVCFAAGYVIIFFAEPLFLRLAIRNKK